MADSNQMSNHPDDSPNSTKKRAGISEDEGSAVLIKDQSKRLKMESDAKYIEARNKAIDMAIALEKECIRGKLEEAARGGQGWQAQEHCRGHERLHRDMDQSG